MSKKPAISPKTLACGLGAIALLAVSGCVTNEDAAGGVAVFGNPGYQTRTVVQNDYFYFPDYDIYYNRASGEFLSVENGRWTSRNRPLNVPVNRLLASRAVSVNTYISPQHHREVYLRRNVRQGRWQPASNAGQVWNSSDRQVLYQRY